MARHLKKNLAQGRAGLTQFDAHRRPETLSWLGDLTGDRLAAGQEWRRMGATLQARRAGVMAPEAPAPKPHKARAAVKAPPVKEAMEEEEEAGAEAREAMPESGALEERVFGYLADHPDGVRLVAIEQEFRLNRLESNRVVRFLIEEGKARKLGRVYFAT